MLGTLLQSLANSCFKADEQQRNGEKVTACGMSDDDIEKENLAADIYNCACEIDEAIIALVEKIGNCTKAITISKMYGKSPLAESHKTIIARDNI